MSEIGANIRWLRRLRHMTLSDIAKGCADYGLIISPTQISMWETGKRRIYADQLEIICQVLACSPTAILKKYNNDFFEYLSEFYSNVPRDERDIIEYCINTWDGNSRALVLFMGMYMSMPPYFRKDFAEYGIWKYEKCLEEGIILPDAPPIDFEYVMYQASRIGK